MPAKAKPSSPAAPAAPAFTTHPAAVSTHSMPELHQDFEEFVDSLGLKFFRGHEFTEYWTRQRGNVQNECPPQTIWHRIVPTLLVVDRIRLVLGHPITINSTYRSPRYNKAVGGESNSFHMRFMAMDFSSAHARARELHEVATSMRGQIFSMPGNGGNFRFAGGIGLYVSSNFVHLDCRGTNADWSGK